MTTSKPVIRIVGIDDVPANRKRGGDLRTVLSPGTVGATSGFMGLAILQPGEYVVEHYHPYSEEFLYVIAGTVNVDLDGNPHTAQSGQGLLVPIGVRHRVCNTGTEEARIVFHLSPLAPRPELGHVDTEVLS
ncbi:cupin domain-containing protein [Solwaraspora sp. WMMD406]|uniref:cupin domain-containing protein n=1 Tax=Solwaraspora sp. WMMD406 TaxID=3016095 RepID=UPI002416D08A|nr:cupin domain-containing protein [Solwaraspora sp. WMMD406]MDG4763525.1 cupin domain-containing protein [Solwaraspora sp. WMMD406]